MYLYLYVYIYICIFFKKCILIPCTSGDRPELRPRLGASGPGGGALRPEWSLWDRRDFMVISW